MCKKNNDNNGNDDDDDDGGATERQANEIVSVYYTMDVCI